MLRILPPTSIKQIRLLTSLNVGGETHNIAVQLILHQCCKTSCTFFVARDVEDVITPTVLSDTQLQ